MTDIGFPNNASLDQGSQIHGRTADPIQGVGHENRLREVGEPRQARTDQVEISEQSRELDRHLSALRQLPKIREEKIANARQAIEDGRLDTNEALSQAIEVMIDEATIL